MYKGRARRLAVPTLRSVTVHYEGQIIRPPSEADSILLQVTVGCSHNRCAFCGAYSGERFRIKSDEEIVEDIRYAAEHFPDRRRLFLCDGDPLIIPHERLLRILEWIAEYHPGVRRVGAYANAKSVGRKSLEQLTELRAHRLRIIHLGLESGDDEVLAAMNKSGDSAFIVEQGRKVRAARIKLFVTVLLGLGGRVRSELHARETGRALTAMNPDYVGALTLMLIPGTPLFRAWEDGRFELPDAPGMLRELRSMIAHTQLEPGLFFANHASNYLPIQARLPADKAETLALIDAALSGFVPLKPEWRRGL